jgi:rod shape-determining protein MreC
VIGTAGTDQSRVLYIDKGARDGVKPDMAVITPDGIVGKIKDVFRTTAQVLEISDQTSGAGVLLESTRLRGVLRGNAFGQPQVINLMPDERVKPGERVITSGGDQIFPRGLPVGVVDHVAPDTQNPPYVDVIVKPAANLGHLEEVLIITATGSQMPADQKIDLVQSAAAAGAQRAADILSQRLPGLDQPETASDKANADFNPLNPPPLRPPPPLHPDRFTPNATPPAAGLVPGRDFTVSDSVVLPDRPRTAAKPTIKPTAADHSGRPPDAGQPGESAVHKHLTHPAAPAEKPVAPKSKQLSPPEQPQ